ncbi:MAG: hypothetical protein WD226_12420 [Planctomycetota bacterium]
MRKFKDPAAYAQQTGFTSGEKKRLIGLSVALLLVLLAIGWGWFKTRAVTSPGTMPAEVPLQESIAIPALDTAKLDAQVRDATAEQRVLLDDEALDFLLTHVRRLTPRHYEALGARVLDDELRERLLEEPSAARGTPLTVRGWLHSAEARRRSPTAALEYAGRLVDDDGHVTYFVTDDVPDLMPGVDFVRLDGRFLGVFSEEDPEAPGRWIEAPLVVGTKLIQSRLASAPVNTLNVAYLQQQIEHDHVTRTESGMPGIATYDQPSDAIWHVMAWGRDGADALDWNAAPEIDAETLQAVSETPDRFVGQAFRFPISRLQGVRVRRAPENAPRFEEYTEGWLGNSTWKNVVHFWSPIPDRELELADYVRAQGVFVRNFAYDSAKHGVRIAPLFVITHLESFEPVSAPIYRNMAIAISVGAILLTLLFIGLVRRDRKRAARSEQELIERRRARRASPTS